MSWCARSALVVAFACSLATPIHAEPNELLARLGRELTRIRAATSSDPVEIPQPVPEVDSLVGFERGTIEQSLGRPDSPPQGCPPQSCPRGVAVWEFFKLPTGWRGGGPELHLTIDSSDRCTSATWRYSR